MMAEVLTNHYHEPKHPLWERICGQRKSVKHEENEQEGILLRCSTSGDSAC